MHSAHKQSATNTMTIVYTTLVYEHRHKNKGSGLGLVPKTFTTIGVYKWDQRVIAYKMYTVQIKGIVSIHKA